MASVAADLARRNSVTRWSAEATVHAGCKNIFAFAGEHGAYHVGTFFSGSKSKLSRFEADCNLIAAAPDGFTIIEQLEESFTADGTYQQFLPAMRAFLAKARGEAL